MTITVLSIFGTKPEALKMAHVQEELRSYEAGNAAERILRALLLFKGSN